MLKLVRLRRAIAIPSLRECLAKHGGATSSKCNFHTSQNTLHYKTPNNKNYHIHFYDCILMSGQKKKGHFKSWEWRGAFHRLLCCKKKDHYQRHRNCSKGWNHSWHIQGGSPQGQPYLGWGDRQAGSAAAAWPGDDAPHHLQGLQGTSYFLPFIWARRITAEPHRCQWPWTSVQAALQKSTGQESQRGDITGVIHLLGPPAWPMPCGVHPDEPSWSTQNELRVSMTSLLPMCA